MTCRHPRSHSHRAPRGSHVEHVEGQIALITTGSCGLRAASAAVRAAQGTDVATNCDESADEAEKAVRELKKTGRRAIEVKGHQTDIAAAELPVCGGDL